MALSLILSSALSMFRYLCAGNQVYTVGFLLGVTHTVYFRNYYDRKSVAFTVKVPHMAAVLLLLLLCMCVSSTRALSTPSNRAWLPSEVARLRPTALAYLGDAVFETAARRRLLWPPERLDEYSKRVQELTRAEGQSDALKRLVESPQLSLSKDELEWLRRGRNASGRGPSRVSAGTYRASTALECLIGYLSLTDTERMDQIVELVLTDSGFPPCGPGVD